jgi:hypothetical protein
MHCLLLNNLRRITCNFPSDSNNLSYVLSPYLVSEACERKYFLYVALFQRPNLFLYLFLRFFLGGGGGIDGEKSRKWPTTNRNFLDWCDTLQGATGY